MTQGELEKLTLPIQRQFFELEVRIMSDIVRRIEINGFSTASADWQITRLQQLGESEEKIKEWVQAALKASDEELETIFSDTVYQQYYQHARAYKLFGVKQIPYAENKRLQELVEAVRRQTKETFVNMTGSMGFAIEMPGNMGLEYKKLREFYTDTLDAAMLDIKSGAFDYQRVLTKTINTMTKSGLRWVDYETGWHNRVDVAARRSVMAGFRQIQGKINEQVAEELDTDYYEVTYHVGARPEHQQWQGKVWSYKELQEVCGLGTVTGLHGANCYHDYNAFVPGASVRTYTNEQLEKMIAAENEKKDYNGREYTTYEALQQQRKMETSIRKTRRDIKLLEAGHADEAVVNLHKAKYKGKIQLYEDFSDKMDLPLQYSRIHQDGLKGNFNPGRKVWKETQEKVEARKTAKEKKANYAKFSERFTEYNNGQKDVITTRRLMNNLNKTEIGRETVKYIFEHPELQIQMCYNIDHEKGLLGQQIGNDISVYVSDTKNVQRTAEIIIHEITHHRYDIGESQWAESVCFAQELKHRTNKNELTMQELKGIIKTVRELYPKLPWR